MLIAQSPPNTLASTKSSKSFSSGSPPTGFSFLNMKSCAPNAVVIGSIDR